MAGILVLALIFSQEWKLPPLPPLLRRAGSLVLLALCILSMSTGGFHPFLYFQF